MALNEAALSGLIFANLSEEVTPSKPQELQKFCDAIAKAVVTHIQSSAQVQVTGVMSGPSSAVGTVE